MELCNVMTPIEGVRKRSPMTQELMKVKIDYAQAV